MEIVWELLEDEYEFDQDVQNSISIENIIVSLHQTFKIERKAPENVKYLKWPRNIQRDLQIGTFLNAESV